MPRSSGRRLAAIGFLLVLVIAACARDDADEATDRQAPSEITITATDHTFDVPKSISASTVDFRFENEGEFVHEAAFAKLGDQSREDIFDAMDALVESEFEGPIPAAFYNGLQGIGELQPGEGPTETEATMTSGRWLLFCAFTDEETEGGDEEDGEGSQQEGQEGEDTPATTPHYRLGMFAEIVVTGDDEPEAPSGDATVMMRDYTFEADLTAGEQTLAIVNEGPDQLHHIVAFDSGEGVDPAKATEEFKQQFAQEGGDEEAEGEGEEDGAMGDEEEPEEAFFSGIMSPGYGQTVKADLESGHTYLFACFIHDRNGGPPHAIAHDMVKAFAVP